MLELQSSALEALVKVTRTACFLLDCFAFAFESRKKLMMLLGRHEKLWVDVVGTPVDPVSPVVSLMHLQTCSFASTFQTLKHSEFGFLSQSVSQGNGIQISSQRRSMWTGTRNHFADARAYCVIFDTFHEALLSCHGQSEAIMT